MEGPVYELLKNTSLPKLNRPLDWPRWYPPLQINCQILKIWDEVNPESTTPVNVETSPENPATLGAGAAAAYEASDSLDPRHRQVLGMIYASLDAATKRSVLGNPRVQGKEGPHTLRAVIRAVKDIFAPDDDRLGQMVFENAACHARRQNVSLRKAAKYLEDGAIHLQDCYLFSKIGHSGLLFLMEGFFKAVSHLNFGLYIKHMEKVKDCTTVVDMLVLVHGYKHDIRHLKFLESQFSRNKPPGRR